ncbi:MAG: DNA polymerase III subunits gamma and tau [Rhodanobacteraceae bacterium]|jgi:DNA polymerase-3 subunit gamma/tau|nr:MAG: DNA polymerase III subunits gamma and tau [Rhodanobacteraceae bacterium]
MGFRPKVIRMSYQVLARKWRPKQFAELVGQEHVVKALAHALDSGRVHHAYLFTGTRGVGKTTIARIFAKSLNCERGMSAHPCGECAICTAVDAGRFVDLIEIDAASNTGVDDVRELIESAQYAPARGRFKVYLIDEVHMLSKSAFNALLKTLEEPPEHVKFLLATTDPQKLPVTVLSRCLKFGLKRLLPEQIAGQMKMILGKEGIAFDDGAIAELARGADGSLRDGLSLLDQAIAHGGGTLRADDVRAMLGTIADNDVGALLQALADGDGKALMDEADRIAGLSPDFAVVLEQLANALHRIQLRQLVPGFAGDEPEREVLDELAGKVDPEDVQVWYQFALHGRRDLPLAPDVRSGFEMTLLRMLAFRNEEPGGQVASVPAHAAANRASPSAASAAPAPRVAVAPAQARGPAPPQAPVAAPKPAATPHIGGIADWEAWIRAAGLGGPVGLLAQHALPKSFEGDVLTLALKPEHEILCSDALCRQLQDRLGDAIGRKLRVRIVHEAVAETPAARAAKARSDAQAAAERALAEDPIIQDMQRQFGAEIIRESIRPAGNQA